jgi:hypothetical protein
MKLTKRILIGMMVLLTLSSCRIYEYVNVVLHTNLDGSCLYSTKDNETQELFCVALPTMINGIGYDENSVYLAIGRGDTISVEKRTLSGELLEQYNLQTEAGTYGALYDLATDDSGLWASNGYKVIHYDLNIGLKDKEIILPTGYNSTYGVVYDQTTGYIAMLILDESGLVRNCPAIATYDSNLEMIDFILVPGINCLSPVFGLGYDTLTQSFWTSTSFQSPDPNLLLNISISGELIQSIPIDHQYGSVEAYASVKSYKEIKFPCR